MLGAYWDNGQAWSLFQCLQRGSGRVMGTFEESLMASKADNPIFHKWARPACEQGVLPLAAALFGTAECQPQWLHHNFLPVIDLRVYAKISPSTLSYQQQVALLGLWERRPPLELRAGPLPKLLYSHLASQQLFRAPEEWTASVKEKSSISCSVPSGSIRVRQPTRRKLRILWLTDRRSGHSGFFDE